MYEFNHLKIKIIICYAKDSFRTSQRTVRTSLRMTKQSVLHQETVTFNVRVIHNLTFVGPCIVIYFYSKTNQMHIISNLFYFGTTLYMFLTVSSSIIRSLRLYIQHHTIQVLWLLASKQPHNLYDVYLMLYVQS